MTEFHVYSNDGLGGPIDWSTPVATVAALTWNTPVLSPNGDYSYAVRSFDTVSGLERPDVTARVRIVLDGAGNDITNRPSKPYGVTLQPLASGTLRVYWLFNRRAEGEEPTGFRIWCQNAASVNFALAADATLAYSAIGPNWFAIDIAGLTAGARYTVGVKAYGPTGESLASDTVKAVMPSSGPSAVDSVSGSST